MIPVSDTGVATAVAATTAVGSTGANSTSAKQRACRFRNIGAANVVVGREEAAWQEDRRMKAWQSTARSISIVCVSSLAEYLD